MLSRLFVSEINLGDRPKYNLLEARDIPSLYIYLFLRDCIKLVTFGIIEDKSIFSLVKFD